MAELWSTDGDGPRPLGIACRSCGARSFPPAPSCRACGSAEIDRVPFAATGRIETWSASGPDAVAEVRLDDGMLVFGRVEPAAGLAVGLAVRFAPTEMMRFVPS